jgi:hypothetical protein
MRIRTEGQWFKDAHGRTLLPRGVNLGGSSKVPFARGATHIREGFFDHREVSFVGRPFPLEEADEHFARLREWGLTFIRLLVTWEAVEHAGPGRYDEAYLDYVRAVAEKAGECGLSLFIDPHQDMWSRFSGGDGAPGWTFECVGMDVTKFRATGAAHTHQEHGGPLPIMFWPSNALRYACATLFSLFFGGDAFAPATRVEGVPVQEYLQGHYIETMRQVALRLKGLPQVVGYDTLNEPLSGYIGREALDRPVKALVAQGETPTAYQGMLLAAGYPQEVAFVPRMALPSLRTKRVLVNPEGVSLWLEGHEPIWRQNGVWDLDPAGNPHLLRPAHFHQVDGRAVDFQRDHLVPFIERYIRVIRSVDPEALIFVESQPAELAAGEHGALALETTEGIVHAPHWYDGLTLGFQRYLPWLGADAHGGGGKLVFGRRRVRRAFREQVKRLKDLSVEMGGVPTLIGETGIPYNLDGRKAYRTGDFSRHVMAIDDTLQALEANLVSFTLWDYTADNDNVHGDQWNGEDLSIYSRDQRKGTGTLHDGGRALEAVVRPYARAVTGEPLATGFDLKTRVFTFAFRHDPEIEGVTEFYVPAYQYPDGCRVTVSGGRYEVDRGGQTVRYAAEGAGVHTVRIEPAL